MLTASLAIILAAWGWLTLFSTGEAAKLLPSNDLRFDQAAYLTLKAVTMDGVYADIKSGWPWQLRAARWFGAITTLAAGLLAIFALFSRGVAELRAWFAGKHLLIIGDHPLAEIAAGDREGRKRWPLVVWFAQGADRAAASGDLVTRPAPADPAEGFGSVGLTQAARVVVALPDDAATQAVALAASRLLADSGRPLTPVIAHMRDPWLAARFHHIAADARNLIVISEAAAAARQVTFRHPPFLLALARRQPRICVLIFGAGSVGEALVEEIVANGACLGLGKPVVLVVERDEAVRQRILERRPALALAADVRCAASLEEVLPFKPADVDIQAAYVCAGPDAAALTQAAGLRERALQDGLFDAPIFVRLTTGGGLTVPPASGRWGPKAPVLRPGECMLIPFGGIDGLLEVTGLSHPGDPDAAAKAWHEAYLGFIGPGGQAAVPWTELAEDYRTSNRRAVAHIPAKLVSAGFDIEPWLEAGDLFSGPPPIAEALAPTPELRTALARLEHDRWIADRCVNGWRPPQASETRDNRRKIHPDLAPFDDLPESTQDYDLKLIDFLDQYLVHSNKGLTRRA